MKTSWCTKWWTAYGNSLEKKRTEKKETSHVYARATIYNLCIAPKPSIKTIYSTCKKLKFYTRPQESSSWLAIVLYTKCRRKRNSMVLHTAFKNAQNFFSFFFVPLITKVERHFCCRFGNSLLFPVATTAIETHLWSLHFIPFVCYFSSFFPVSRYYYTFFPFIV